MKTFNKELKKMWKGNGMTYAMVVIIFLCCFIYISTGMASHLFKGLMVPICVNVILAISLNLTVGILGELSLGHAGFMCIGAFVGSVFSMLTADALPSVWIRFPLAFIVGGCAAAVIGLLVGIPTLRLRGDYLAIVTLAFGEIIKNICNNLYVVRDVNGLKVLIGVDAYNKVTFDGATKKTFVNGAMGITGTPSDSNYFIGFLLILITLVVILNLVNSRTGRAVMSIRDNRIASESIGINITKYKLIAFTLSAFFAGTAGVLYSHNLASVVATKFDYNYSILILVFVVLGGIGSMKGSIIAAIVLTALPEFLRELMDYRMLIYAVILIVMMIINNNEKVQQQVQRFKRFLSFKMKRKEGAGGCQ